MLNYLVYLIFILAVAMTAGGIILSTRLRSRYRSEIFSTLLYFQVFIFAFGFYGIWGQVILNAFLASYILPGLLLRIQGIAILLGLPFLVFAWLMLLQFSLSLSGRRKNRWFIILFLLSNFLIIIGIGYKISNEDADISHNLIKYYFITFNFLYTLGAAMIMAFSERKKSLIHEYDRRVIVPVLIITGAGQCVLLFFYTSQFWLGLLFILAFYGGNIFLPLYLNYGTLLSAFASPEPAKDLSFEGFCKKFEVSPRESDIVREICNGLSNKEISGKLFISLQTVKDHTHRIYIKTNVKSRVQLINLVKDEVQVTASRQPDPGV